MIVQPHPSQLLKNFAAYRGLMPGLRKGFHSILLTGGGSVVSLGFAAVGGILLIRILPPEDYGRYVLVFGFSQTFQLLGEGGAAQATSNEARKDWQNQAHLSEVLAAGKRVQRRQAAVAMALGLPILIYLTLKHGATWGTAIPMAFVMAAIGLLHNQSALRSVPLPLQQRIGRLQMAQVSGDGLRLLLVALLLPLIPLDLAALFILLAGFALKNQILGRVPASAPGEPSDVQKDAETSIKAFVKRIRPVWIYACFAGSVSTLLASMFGQTLDIAAVGGLSRLTILASISSFAFGTVIVPYYARELVASKLPLRFTASVGLLILFSLASTVPLIAIPGFWLKLLGEGYLHLATELRIAAAGAAINLIYSGLYALSLARGNLVPPWRYLAIVLLWQIALFALFDLSSLRGVLWIGALTPLPGALAYFVSAARGTWREVRLSTQPDA